MTDLERPGVQDFVDPWWTTGADSEPLCPGRLIKAFVPFPDVQTYGLVLEGRKDPLAHDKAVYRMEPLQKARTSWKKPTLPVAAMPGQFVAQRGKVRPAVVLATGGIEVPRSVSKGGPGYQRKPCILLAPYYGADKDGTRAGFAPEFIDRIRTGEYPQFILDELPLPGSEQSVLRLDHVLASGAAASNYEITEHVLSDEALQLVRDWFRWFVEGTVPGGGMLALIQEEYGRVTAIE